MPFVLLAMNFVGKFTSNTLVIAINRTGGVNCNANGLKGRVGFEEQRSLRIPINIFLGTQKIRDLLDANVLKTYLVKAVFSTMVQHEQVPEEMLKRMPNADINKAAEVYYFQDFNIACPNVD